MFQIKLYFYISMRYIPVEQSQIVASFDNLQEALAFNSKLNEITQWFLKTNATKPSYVLEKDDASFFYLHNNEARIFDISQWCTFDTRMIGSEIVINHPDAKCKFLSNYRK